VAKHQLLVGLAASIQKPPHASTSEHHWPQGGIATDHNTLESLALRGGGVAKRPGNHAFPIGISALCEGIHSP
jgi:hypothetical protein